MQRRNMSIILANVLDHFDSNLYGFIAPIMAPLFFPKQDPIIQLILTYSFLATSSITRPLGVVIFGWCAKHYNPWQILRISLIGVGLSTMLIGFLPTFKTAGYMAAVSLLGARILGGLFAEGEKAIAGIVLLDNKTNKHAIITNAWFSASVILGCIMASFASTLISENTWRIPFWCGGVLALYGAFLRLSAPLSESKQPPLHNKQKPTILAFLSIIFSGGLSYVTYDLSFILINSYVPLITNITRETMMSWNTLLLLFDLLICIPIGYMVWNYDALKIKRLSALMLALPAIPMFYFMENATLPYVLFVKAWIVWWGVVFSCVLTVWWLRLFPHKSKYLWIGISSAIGTSLIGRSTSALCLWGWHKTHMAAIPGIYLCVVALLVLATSKPSVRT